jgi:hypothetical protein
VVEVQGRHVNTAVEWIKNTACRTWCTCSRVDCVQNDAEDTGYSCGIDMRNAMMDVDARNPILHFGVPMSWPSSSMKQSS